MGVAEELVARDLGRVLMVCEERAEEAILAAQAPEEQAVVLSDAERAAALGLLTDPKLVNRIVGDFDHAGVVGEAANCLVGYLAAVSRKLDRPLAVIVQSTSAAGKSALQDAVLAMVPEEERVSFSAMTGQSLFYMAESDLAHKVLAVSEEEVAERASYALKLLQSEGELSIASTGKDGTTGRLVTHTYRVRGPVAIFLTTTAVDVDEELLNRCIVLSVDEDRPDRLTGLVSDYVKRSGVGKPGACHLFRHTMATLMLEGGADIRFIQQMLGHADISTTQIYTQVSLRQLRAIHAATHPAASNTSRRHRPDPGAAIDTGDGLRVTG